VGSCYQRAGYALSTIYLVRDDHAVSILLIGGSPGVDRELSEGRWKEWYLFISKEMVQEQLNYFISKWVTCRDFNYLF
jgi:hypothetical protein